MIPRWRPLLLLLYGIIIQKSDAVDPYAYTETYTYKDTNYMFFSQRVTWNEANILCPNYRSRLAVVDSGATAKFLAQSMAYSNMIFEDIWIGGRQLHGTWVWISGVMIPTKQDYEGYPPWTRTQFRIGKDCLAMDRRLHDLPLFVDGDCALTRPFICEKSSSLDTGSPIPVKWVPIGESTFVLYHGAVTWNKAVSFCRNHEMRLAVVSSNEQAVLLASAMTKSRPDFENMWVGGHNAYDYFAWLTTGELISLVTDPKTLYPPWRFNATENKKGCILLDRHVCDLPVFEVLECDRKRDFICELAPPYEIDIIEPPLCFKVKDVTLVLFAGAKDWDGAVNRCQDLGGGLVTLEDGATVTAIMDNMADHPNEIKHVWVGGQWIDNKWKWLTNTTISESSSFLTWCNTHHSNNDYACVNLDRKGHSTPIIYGLLCNTTQSFVCAFDTTDKLKGICSPTEEKNPNDKEDEGQDYNYDNDNYSEGDHANKKNFREESPKDNDEDSEKDDDENIQNLIEESPTDNDEYVEEDNEENSEKDVDENIENLIEESPTEYYDESEEDDVDNNNNTLTEEYPIDDDDESDEDDEEHNNNTLIEESPIDDDDEEPVEDDDEEESAQVDDENYKDYLVEESAEDDDEKEEGGVLINPHVERTTVQTLTKEVNAVVNGLNLKKEVETSNKNYTTGIENIASSTEINSELKTKSTTLLQPPLSTTPTTWQMPLLQDAINELISRPATLATVPLVSFPKISFVHNLLEKLRIGGAKARSFQTPQITTTPSSFPQIPVIPAINSQQVPAYRSGLNDMLHHEDDVLASQDYNTDPEDTSPTSSDQLRQSNTPINGNSSFQDLSLDNIPQNISYETVDRTHSQYDNEEETTKPFTYEEVTTSTISQSLPSQSTSSASENLKLPTELNNVSQSENVVTEILQSSTISLIPTTSEQNISRPSGVASVGLPSIIPSSLSMHSMNLGVIHQGPVFRSSKHTEDDDVPEPQMKTLIQTKGIDSNAIKNLQKPALRSGKNNDDSWTFISAYSADLEKSGTKDLDSPALRTGKGDEMHDVSPKSQHPGNKESNSDNVNKKMSFYRNGKFIGEDFNGIAVNRVLLKSKGTIENLKKPSLKTGK